MHAQSSYAIRGGRWVVTGPLPNNCELTESEGAQIFVDATGEPQPDCFGVWWEAVGPAEETAHCVDCDMAPMCRVATVHFRLPQVLQQSATVGALTIEAIAPELELNHTAVAALLEDYQRMNAPRSAAENVKRPKRAPPRRNGGPPVESNGGPPRNPTRAPSAMLVADGAMPTVAKRIYARLAKVWDAERRIWIRPWEARLQCLRERQGSPWLQRLEPGMILHRSRQGRWHTVRVCRHSYQYRGRRYPTLAMVTAEVFRICPGPRRSRGKVPRSPQSLAVFWCLAELFRSPPNELVVRGAEREATRLLRKFYGG